MSLMQVRESIPTAERNPVAQWLWHATTEMLMAVLTANPGLKNAELRVKDSCRAQQMRCTELVLTKGFIE